MTLDEIIRSLELTPITQPRDYSDIVPDGGYASDLLSCVMAGAKHHGLWITLQSHTNIVAVAALLDLCAVIITENGKPDEITIQKANSEKVILLSTPKSTYEIVGRLWELGLPADV